MISWIPVGLIGYLFGGLGEFVFPNPTISLAGCAGSDQNSLSKYCNRFKPDVSVARLQETISVAVITVVAYFYQVAFFGVIFMRHHCIFGEGCNLLALWQVIYLGFGN